MKSIIIKRTQCLKKCSMSIAEIQCSVYQRASLLIVVAALTLSACGVKTINLADYIETDVEGLNGHATAVCDLDYDALYAAIASQQKNDGDSFLQQAAILEEAFSHITLAVDPCENLSNGDMVTVTATYDAPKNLDIGCKLKNGKTSFKEEGLSDGQLFNFFDESAVSVTFSGMSGNGTAGVEILSTEDAYRYTQYTVSPANGLSNGDEVVLSAQTWDGMLDSMGYYAEEFEKTYTVAGLPEPFAASDKISAADRSRLEALALEKATQEVEDWYSYMNLSDMRCGPAYCYTGHVESFWSGLNSTGGVVMLVSCDFGVDGAYTIAVFFQNCGKDGTGSVTFKQDDIAAMSEEISSADGLAWLENTFSDAVFTQIS